MYDIELDEIAKELVFVEESRSDIESARSVDGWTASLSEAEAKCGEGASIPVYMINTI